MLKIKVFHYNYTSGMYDPIGYYQEVDEIDGVTFLVCGDFKNSRRFRNVHQVHRVLTMLDLKFEGYSYEIEDIGDVSNERIRTSV